MCGYVQNDEAPWLRPRSWAHLNRRLEGTRHDDPVLSRVRG